MIKELAYKRIITNPLAFNGENNWARIHFF